MHLKQNLAKNLKNLSIPHSNFSVILLSINESSCYEEFVAKI